MQDEMEESEHGTVHNLQSMPVTDERRNPPRSARMTPEKRLQRLAVKQKGRKIKHSKMRSLEREITEEEAEDQEGAEKKKQKELEMEEVERETPENEEEEHGK